MSNLNWADHVPYIERCYELADEAVVRGDHPFGALLVVDGEVVATACNAALTSGDVTRHAEMVLLATALPTLKPDLAARATLYSSTEPCVMCAAAIYWSGVSSIVYGCSAASLASAAGQDFLVPCSEIFGRGERAVTVIGPVLDAEGRLKHLAYWKGENAKPGSGAV
jgi:tRNA(Arg) A34 adenosine deaminase TadA